MQWPFIEGVPPKLSGGGEVIRRDTRDDRGLPLFIDKEEFRMRKALDKTELITRVAPVLGLMGTLIPLGPGLAMLGQGDITGLAESIIIAFDTTVVGIAIGAIASILSKMRRRWYQKDINELEVILELIEGSEIIGNEEAEKTNAGRRSGS